MEHYSFFSSKSHSLRAALYVWDGVCVCIERGSKEKPLQKGKRQSHGHKIQREKTEQEH